MKRWIGILAAILALSASLRAGPLTVGERIFEPLESPHPYGVEDRSEPVGVWSGTLHFPGATYIAPHFSRFELGDGDFVIVRSPDGKRSLRYEEGRGKLRLAATRDGFWSAHISGDTAIVELFSRHAKGGFGIVIDSFARGFSDPELRAANGLDQKSICGDDDAAWARCYADSEPEIYEESRSVARLTINGTLGCTGWLIGCDGHLLTNNHCIEDDSDAANTDFEFLAEGPSCETDCVGAGACPGVIEADSATLVKTDWDLDYSLLLLPVNVTPTYGFLRMRDSGPVIDERIYVPQHPSSWGKRIAVLSSDPSDESGFCEISSLDETPCHAGPGDVGYFADTQGGASGAPVLAYGDHRVVALHHCANCANRGINTVDLIAALGTDLPRCSIEQLIGTVRLDRPFYGCSDTLVVTVRDDSIIGAGSQQVAISSTREGPPETLTLSEVDAGRFVGSFDTTTAAPLPGDGLLSVAHGNVITVQYVDADDGEGGTNLLRQSTALTDCQPPTIAGVTANDVTGTYATIEWTTDQPADSQVAHGLAPPGSATTTRAGLTVDHAVVIEELQECTPYYYSVTSTDAAGNTATDDNGGLGHTFSTGRDDRPQRASADTPLPIPDNDPGGAVSTISVADENPVIDVDVTVRLFHTYDADLTLTLVPPSGPEIALANRRGGALDDYIDTLFDDEADVAIALGSPPFTGSFRPDQPLSSADGISAAGNWRLRVVDHSLNDVGQIETWTLALTYPPRICGAHAEYTEDQPLLDVCITGGAGSGDSFWDPGEQVQFSLSLANDGSLPLTGVTARLQPVTAGVRMLDDTAIFGSLQPEQIVTSQAPHFAALLPSNLACGEAVEFSVEIHSDQGSWTPVFARPVGDVIPGNGVALSESFDSGIPASWQVIDGFADGHSWFSDDPGDPAGCLNADPSAPLAGAWVAVDSDCAGSGITMDEELISPILDLSGASAVTLEFDHYLDYYAPGLPELADVDVRSSETGGAWVNVGQWTADTANGQHETIDITAEAAGASDAQIRWHYYNANFEFYWFVDNVDVSYTIPGSCSVSACAAGPAGPPPVPDGTGPGAPMRADRLDTAGTQIMVSWDGSCPAVSSKILFGPLDQVGSHLLGGSVCGVSSPRTWDVTSVPGDVWFVVVADDGSAVEGSWGLRTGGERNGLTASGECDATFKDLSGSCP